MIFIVLNCRTMTLSLSDVRISMMWFFKARLCNPKNFVTKAEDKAMLLHANLLERGREGERGRG